MQSRAEILGRYIVGNGATVRQTAAEFGISKSTVHKDVTKHLQTKDSLLAQEVKEVLEHNKAERHIRGGIATREMYLKRRMDVNRKG